MKKKVFDAYRQRITTRTLTHEWKTSVFNRLHFRRFLPLQFHFRIVYFLIVVIFVHLLFAIHVTQRFFSLPPVRLLIAKQNTENPNAKMGLNEWDPGGEECAPYRNYAINKCSEIKKTVCQSYSLAQKNMKKNTHTKWTMKTR